MAKYCKIREGMKTLGKGVAILFGAGVVLLVLKMLSDVGALSGLTDMLKLMYITAPSQYVLNPSGVAFLNGSTYPLTQLFLMGLFSDFLVLVGLVLLFIALEDAHILSNSLVFSILIPAVGIVIFIVMVARVIIYSLISLSMMLSESGITVPLVGCTMLFVALLYGIVYFVIDLLCEDELIREKKEKERLTAEQTKNA